MLTKTPTIKSIKSTSGFTLIEILISIVVFSVGLIGIAKMQIVSKQANYDAVQRVTAATLASKVIDRMRANTTELATYVSANGVKELGQGTVSSEPSPTCVSGSTCTTTQLATHDLWSFEQAVDGVAEQNSDGDSVGGLSLPTLCISGSNAGISGVYTVAIAWRGKTALSNPTANTCGEASGDYGDNNEYRRLLVMQTFIAVQ